MNTAKITGAPDVIYLTYGDIDKDSDHYEILQDSEIGWCDDQIDETDIKYVRADLYDKLESVLKRVIMFHIVSDDAWNINEKTEEIFKRMMEE